jgi:alpha-galactosidase
VNDPDCVVARPTYSQREPWARAAHRLGGLRSFSDRLADLDPWGLATVRDLMAAGGRTAPLAAEVIAESAALAQAEGAAR